jgi:hypothetical protein
MNIYPPSPQTDNGQLPQEEAHVLQEVRQAHAPRHHVAEEGRQGELTTACMHNHKTKHRYTQKQNRIRSKIVFGHRNEIIT